MIEGQNADLERKLQGRTLQVYLYLQKKKEPAGIREVQRDLGLSSPSVAEYQVEKLVELGIAGRDTHGRAFVTKRVKVKALESYVNFGRFAVPRLAFYASIFSAIAGLYFAFSAGSPTLYGAAVPSAAAGIFWFEAWKMWKQNHVARRAEPKEEKERDYFWVSLAPGLGALAAFIAACLFLFYYVEPAGIVVDRAQPFDQGDSTYMPSPTSKATIDEMVDRSERIEDVRGVIDFTPELMTMLLFAGALVTGFVVYLLVGYSKSGVLPVERN
jgi:hypothetical protein